MSNSSNYQRVENVCPLTGKTPCLCNLREQKNSRQSMRDVGALLAAATEDSRNRLMRDPGAPEFNRTSVDTQGSYTLTYARPC